MKQKIQPPLGTKTFFITPKKNYSIITNKEDNLKIQNKPPPQKNKIKYQDTKSILTNLAIQKKQQKNLMKNLPKIILQK